MPPASRLTRHRPWPRVWLHPDAWQDATSRLADGGLTLLSLWGETGRVHMAVLATDPPEVAVLSLDCPDGRYPSVGARHAPAIRLERAVRDLFGLQPVGLAG